MQFTQRERKQYLKEIKRLLVCNAKQRKAFLKSFEDNIDEYLKDNPDADFSKIQKDMGTPQEIADGFLENASSSDIKKRMAFVKWIIAGVIIVTLMIVVTLVFSIVDAYYSNRAYGEITITVDSVDEEIIEED